MTGGAGAGGSTVTPDEAIEAIWEITGNDECDGVTFTAASDQWWSVAAHCKHGCYSAESNGQLDLSAAFERVWKKFRRAHRNADS